jgi:hypothetical protein
MPKTVKELGDHILSESDSILRGAAIHSLSHLTIATDDSLDEYVMSIANKVLDLLRSVEEDKTQCPAIFLLAVQMGFCAFVCDKAESLENEKGISHQFYKPGVN